MIEHSPSKRTVTGSNPVGRIAGYTAYKGDFYGSGSVFIYYCLCNGLFMCLRHNFCMVFDNRIF